MQKKIEATVQQLYLKKSKIVLKSYYTLHFRKSAVNLHIEKLASYS